MPDTLTTLTYAEFLEALTDTPHVEWADGQIIPMSPITNRHTKLGLFLLMLLEHWAEAHSLGEVFYEPFQMKTGPDLPGRAPDILFVATENLPRVKNTYLDGPADLVVENISMESRARDRGDKFYEYEAGGVREYGLVDPMRRQAEWYARDEGGLFHCLPLGGDGVWRSTVLPGFWLRDEWLWQEPLPRIAAVQREWGLV